jgi:hypothetical protein
MTLPQTHSLPAWPNNISKLHTISSTLARSLTVSAQSTKLLQQTEENKTSVQRKTQWLPEYYPLPKFISKRRFEPGFCLHPQVKPLLAYAQLIQLVNKIRAMHIVRVINSTHGVLLLRRTITHTDGQNARNQDIVHEIHTSERKQKTEHKKEQCHHLHYTVQHLSKSF